MGSWNVPRERVTWVYFLTQPLTSAVYVALGQLIALPVPQFPNPCKETVILLCRVVGRIRDHIGQVPGLSVLKSWNLLKIVKLLIGVEQGE